MAKYILKADVTLNGTGYPTPTKTFHTGDIIEAVDISYNIAPTPSIPTGQSWSGVKYCSGASCFEIPMQYVSLYLGSSAASNLANNVNNIPTPVKAILGLAAIFIFLKVVKVI